MAQRKELSESEKLNIYTNWKIHGNQWVLIGRLIGRPPSTCASFIKSYNKYGKLFPKRGQPFQITKEEEESVLSIVIGNPESHLKEVSEYTNISPTQVKTILNRNGIHYYERISTPPLNNEHIQKHLILLLIYRRPGGICKGDIPIKTFSASYLKRPARDFFC